MREKSSGTYEEESHKREPSQQEGRWEEPTLGEVVEEEDECEEKE